MPLSKRRTNCRLCNSGNLDLALPLTPTPVADHYIPKEKLPEPQELFSLDLHLCRDCGHVQLLEVVDPRFLFENYIYFTTASPGLVEHFRRYAESVTSNFKMDPNSLVVDIGSNTGSLLKFFQDSGHRVLGIDPAKDISAAANAAGIQTLTDFFTPALAEKIRAEHGSAAVVTANNVFAHADDLSGMAEGVRRLLAKDGIFIFEVNHLVDITQNILFDTVYHEHLCYHSVKPLITFLGTFGMEIFDVQHSSSKGGSIRCFAQLKGGGRAKKPAVGEILALEESTQIHELITWDRFCTTIQRARSELLRELLHLKRNGSKIVGFGASTTVTTIFYHFELAPHLDYIVDDNKSRHGLYSPGYHIPVHSPSKLYEEKPESVLILAWRYAAPIMKNHSAYLHQGGKFLVPLPQLQTFKGT
jgi:SAM-dependent methyltransferase